MVGPALGSGAPRGAGVAMTSPGFLAAWLGEDRAETARIIAFRAEVQRLTVAARSAAHAEEIRCVAAGVDFASFVTLPSRRLTREWRAELAEAFGVALEAVEVKP